MKIEEEIVKAKPNTLSERGRVIQKALREAYFAKDTLTIPVLDGHSVKIEDSYVHLALVRQNEVDSVLDKDSDRAEASLASEEGFCHKIPLALPQLFIPLAGEARDKAIKGKK
jgi:hypothetical protein